MLLNGARSIGATMWTEDHRVRAQLCFESMVKALDGYVEPVPVNRPPPPSLLDKNVCKSG